MQTNKLGMPQCRDLCYAAAAAMTYWVFKCRDRAKSPSMGTKTWTYLESSIRNSAEASTTIEEYLQKLSDRLMSHLRPIELTKISQPTQRVMRVNADGSELQELETDQSLVFEGWQDLIALVGQDGFTEWDLLELCRAKTTIVQVICRLRFEEDRALGMDAPEETIEVEAINV